MNLPNKLTMLRMFMIPLFLLFYFSHNFLWALIVFATASLTDLLDGKIARKYGLITDFGKLMDPLADKLLVVSALCCLTPAFDTLGTICLILILSREFLVTSMRLIAAGKGEVLAADIWGKVKTVTQMVWICLELLKPVIFININYLPIELWLKRNMLTQYYVQGVNLLFVLMVAITVASGVHYIVKNCKLFADA